MTTATDLISIQARRIRNVTFGEDVVDDASRRHRVERYIPGAVTYNLSEYPAYASLAPTDYDRELLRLFAERGVGLIELHEEWNDVLRLYGGDKFSSYDAPGLVEFVELAHSLGLKVLGYFSSGFFNRSDPDFREEWIRYPDSLDEVYYDYAVCSPTSASWRAYLLPRLHNVLDEYGFDGLYNDAGYDWLLHEARARFSGLSLHTVEQDFTLPHDPAFEDLLASIQTLVHERGGVNKLHISWDLAPTAQSRVYDYLWVGELVGSADKLRERSAGHLPYVVPCPDHHNGVMDERDAYLNSIPFLQFPLRVDGRPMTGERVLVDGISYKDPEHDEWNRHCRAIYEHYKAHPDGPYSYGIWDSAIPRPNARDLWLAYLGLYRPMVSKDSVCWIDISESSLFTKSSATPSGVIASLFANEEVYLVLANLGLATVELSLRDQWIDRETTVHGCNWTLQPRSLRFLVKDEEPPATV